MTQVTAPPQVRPTKPKPQPFFIVVGLVALAMTVWSMIQLGFDLGPLFQYNERQAAIVLAYLQPDWGFLLQVWPAWLETVIMAILASVVGCLIGLVFALVSSTATNRSPWVVRVIRAFLSVLRSLPEIGYAYLMVAMVSTGALAGLLALAVFNVGIIAKLTSETIDAVDRGPLEAADAAGATGVQRAVTAVLPQIWPNYLSYCLYVFELNLRASVIMGLVGAGGIGSVIDVERSAFRYEHVSACLVGIIIIVIVLDIASRAIRKRLI